MPLLGALFASFNVLGSYRSLRALVNEFHHTDYGRNQWGYDQHSNKYTLTADGLHIALKCKTGSCGR